MNRKRPHVFITEERKLARDFAINVGYLIQHVRASERLEQTELAERVGTSRATISRLERDAERQQKGQEFERYWSGETNGY